MKNLVIIQALFYLAAKLGKSVSKIQFLKLMYLSDKLHLIRYGRTITGDNFVAMPLGPLGSRTYDVIKCNTDEADQKAFNSMFIKVGSDSFAAKKKLSEVKLDWLSITNKEILNTVIEKFGKDDAISLSDYSHTYPEWFKHEKDLSAGKVRVKAISTTELFSISSAREKLPITREDVAQAKKVFLDACF